MSVPAGYRVGRGWLQVRPGSSARLFLHDIGASAPVRAERLRRAADRREWAYVQRGHAPSSCTGGGVYRLSDFALDLLRLLQDVVPTPALVTAEGASGLVAALAAAAEPALVRGLCLLPAHDDGWGSRPALLVGEDSEPNPRWLAAIQDRRTIRALDDDPMLEHGPPETMPARAVAAALARVAVPWHAPRGHLVEQWLPASLRVRDHR
jgi:pimeloyl-ACP methyl ester carboxylesterase